MHPLTFKVGDKIRHKGLPHQRSVSEKLKSLMESDPIINKAADKYCENTMFGDKYITKKKSFKDGAKWYRDRVLKGIEELITLHIGHANADVGTTALDGLNEVLESVKQELL